MKSIQRGIIVLTSNILTSKSFRVKYLLHQLPFVCRGGRGRAALELGDVCLPFCLAGQAGEAGHIPLEVEVVDGVHDHEQRPPVAINLHLQDADIPLTGNHLRPYVCVSFDVFGNESLIVDEGQSLTISLHNQELANPFRSCGKQSVAKDDDEAAQRHQIAHIDAASSIAHHPLQRGKQRPAEDSHNQAAGANLHVFWLADIRYRSQRNTVNGREHQAHKYAD